MKKENNKFFCLSILLSTAFYILSKIAVENKNIISVDFLVVLTVIFAITFYSIYTEMPRKPFDYELIIIILMTLLFIPIFYLNNEYLIYLIYIIQIAIFSGKNKIYDFFVNKKDKIKQ